MVKSVIIFQHINDLVTFEKFLSEEVIPEFCKADGLSRIQVTTYKPSGLPTPENLLSIQLILDLYWDSIDAMQHFIEIPLGINVATLLMTNPYGEIGGFMCKERFFVPDQNIV